MTPSEIKVWLGFSADLELELVPEIVAGMTDVPMPREAIGDDQLRVFHAFVKCVPTDRLIFLPPRKV